MEQEMEQETKGPHIRIRLDVPHQPTVPAVTFTVPFDGLLTGDDYDYGTFTLLPDQLDFAASHDDQVRSGVYVRYVMAMEAAARTWREAFELIKREQDGEVGQ
jgi:hypothetical protein